jgi:hypothetical protein
MTGDAIPASSEESMMAGINAVTIGGSKLGQ